MNRGVTPVALTALLAVAGIVALAAPARDARAQRPAYDPAVEAVARGIFDELLSPY